ncbi:MAG: PQQ-dependent sugar dehydrogenase [Alphaproteobacteria bacterium]|nr:PQQ-dependent sugar dehydrogenase [Alphaproteobacteria bacterium]
MSFKEHHKRSWLAGLIWSLLALILALLLAILWLLHGEAARQSVDDLTGPNPKLQRPRDEYILPSTHIPAQIGWTTEAQPHPAAGLQVNDFAQGLDHPGRMLVLPNGDVLISESAAPGHTGGVISWLKQILFNINNSASTNKILLLRATGKADVADQRFTLLSGLNSPSGMAVLNNILYVADTDALLAYPFHVGDTQISALPRKVIALPASGPNRHWARNVIVAEDGKHLYVSIGAGDHTRDNNDAAEADRARILQVDPQTGATNVWAGYLRNPAGMSYDPRSKSIWFTATERAMLGPDLPPDFMSRLDFGTLYGWPWAYWGRRPDPRFAYSQDDHHQDFQYYKVPEYALGPHTESLGIAFSAGAKLGPAYGYGAFVAQHGSWNRRPLSGYRVIFVPFEASGYPRKLPLPVLDGFLNAQNQAQGRPMDVAIAKDGTLLVSDDAGGRIWRVSAAP